MPRLLLALVVAVIALFDVAPGCGSSEPPPEPGVEEAPSESE